MSSVRLKQIGFSSDDGKNWKLILPIQQTDTMVKLEFDVTLEENKLTRLTIANPKEAGALEEYRFSMALMRVLAALNM